MITVHHLNNSRSQRILWLLEELAVPYQIKAYTRDLTTNLAPPELKAIHPLGKSPVIDDDGRVVTESGAITDYVIRRHGGGRMAPAPGSDAHETYLEWLHFAEGSAMTPFLLALYTARLGDAAAPLQPRIQDQIGAHVAYFSQSLGSNDWLVENTLSGADVMMSFVAEIAAAQGLGAHFPNIPAYVTRLQARPAWQAAAAKTEPYNFTARG
ncbi:glutathione S-transferase family protein [Polymorphobacter fuscus]|uniref:glutathione transferase n=1 Tax=Sandarakinorhabdus fusca TaxID=1439888 RepID=A0A7C9KYT3_9SPHN|nr:glutathione S-transferase [Polymorphobacter fuscus]KAB7646130.1 glutathione S-transferase [Polymorphobacter fuscus]MQT17328.1 glutathione S-transferase [Polymorphobacter fuscus]NJC10139.1 glutathione S-transferase [Polymorphobacter fuscus]